MTAPTLSAEDYQRMIKAPALLSAEDYQRMTEFERLQPVLSRMLRGEKSPAKVRRWRDGAPVVDQHDVLERMQHDHPPKKCDENSAGGRAVLRQRVLALLPKPMRAREQTASLVRLVGLLLDELETTK